MKTGAKTTLVAIATTVISFALAPYVMRAAGEKNPYEAGRKSAIPILLLITGATLVAHKEFTRRERLRLLAQGRVPPPLPQKPAEPVRPDNVG